VRRLVDDYRSLGDIKWGLLHAQPGSPILDSYERFGFQKPATTYKDFLECSEKNLKKREYPHWHRLEYPYLLPKDRSIFLESLDHFEQVNRLMKQRTTKKVPNAAKSI
jgi:hypothetical protein